MSLVSYVGLTGSGKSYSIMEHVIVPCAKSGRLFYTNIPMTAHLQQDFPKLNMVSFSNEEPENNEQFWSDIPAGALIIIDEAWRYWPAGMNQSKMSTKMKEFFTMHRHKVGDNGLSQEIIFATQDNAQLCSFVRSLIEETFKSNNLSNLGQKNRYRVDIFPLAPTGNPPVKKAIRQLFGKYKKEFYKYYISHTKNEGAKIGQEVKADGRGNLFKSAFFKFGIPFAVIVLIVTYNIAMDAFKGMTGGTAKTKVVKVNNASVVLKKVESLENKSLTSIPETIVIDVKPSSPGLSKVWRIAGILESSKMSTVVISSNTGIRTLPLKKYCTQVELSPDWECLIDDELITMYSGVGSFRLVRDLSTNTQVQLSKTSF